MVSIPHGHVYSLMTDKWMESRLEKDVSLTPRKVAYEYRYYKAIDKRMEPYLRRIARKVKNRLLIRSRRSAMKNNQGNLRGNYNQ